MSSAAFLKMFEAYRNTLGSAYPRQDIAAVVKVFRECAEHQATTQDRIRRTTNLTAGNLSKLVKRACAEGWVKATRRADGTNELSLSPRGRKTFEDFESRCSAACCSSGATTETAGAATLAGRRKSRRSPIEEAKRRTDKLFDY